MGPFTHNQKLTLEIETIISFIELNNSIVEYILYIPDIQDTNEEYKNIKHNTLCDEIYLRLYHPLFQSSDSLMLLESDTDNTIPSSRTNLVSDF
jgi:hypothetical protein